jgi:hypothetical protein
MALTPPPRSSLPRHPDDLPFDADPADVGTATMDADRTLRLQLRSVQADGTIAEALLVVPPTDGRHASYLRHLGGLAPGESKAIPPFPAIDPDAVR